MLGRSITDSIQRQLNVLLINVNQSLQIDY